MIRVRIGAGRVVLDERQPHRLVAGTLKVVLARRVRRQRVSGTVQQSPVGVVRRSDEELALARVLGVAGRFVVHEQYLRTRIDIVIIYRLGGARVRGARSTSVHLAGRSEQTFGQLRREQTPQRTV